MSKYFLRFNNSSHFLVLGSSLYGVTLMCCMHIDKLKGALTTTIIEGFTLGKFIKLTNSRAGAGESCQNTSGAVCALILRLNSNLTTKTAKVQENHS